MCGIYAEINHKSGEAVSKDRLLESIGLMKHRGPDDEGFFLSDYAGLAMRRLSIIDIKGGHQPVFNEQRDKVIVYNGELYNYKELQNDLVNKGHKFVTNSDTEVVLHAFEEYGDSCLDLFNGMFAFVIWDIKRKEFFAARDRLGIKPFFYSLTSDGIIISSEIRPMLKNNSISRNIDENALVDYFSFYYISAPLTIYKDIKRLMPGHCIFLKNGQLAIKKYWDFKFKPEFTNENDAAAAINDVLKKSVKRHLQSEVPVGLFLSSGLDSTAIAAVMSENLKKVKSYTVGFKNGGSYSETEGAKLVANRYKTDHTECIMKPSDLETHIPEIMEHLAEPHGDWTSAVYYQLSKESKKDMTVVLTGAGGDELFAGYPTLIAGRAARLLERVPNIFKTPIESFVKSMPSSYEMMSLDFKLKSFFRGLKGKNPQETHMLFKEIFSVEERGKLLYTDATIRDPFSVFQQYNEVVGQTETDNGLLYLDMKVFLADCNLHVTDMATMMNSQECRVPFCDNEMLELASKIPLSMKLKGMTTKYILRKALKEYLPDEIASMPKKGLSMPTAYWLKNELAGFAGAIINNSKSTYINKEYSKQLLDDHVSGRQNNTRKLTCLLSFLLWQEKYQ